MLHAAQPWLPLFDPDVQADAREGSALRCASCATRRAQGRAQGSTTRRALKRVAERPAAAAQLPLPAPVQVPVLGPLLPSPCPLVPDALRTGELRALRCAFLGLAIGWELSGREALALLGEPMENEAERHERMWALAGVNRSLGLLFPEPNGHKAYLRGSCPSLGGVSPLQLMLEGGRPAIAKLREHLAAKVMGPTRPGERRLTSISQPDS